MVPVAGSAYTYAYATLGELFAWIIGWDLVLEYAVGACDGRARLVALLPGFLRILQRSTLPHILADAPFDYDTNGQIRARPHVFDLPAIVIVAHHHRRSWSRASAKPPASTPSW